MTQSRRIALFLSLLLVVSSGTAAWAVADTGNSVQAQEETQTATDSFQVENFSAPATAQGGDTVTVNATVVNPAGDSAEQTETETEAAEETETETEAAEETETEAAQETEANETETAMTETEAGEETETETETEAGEEETQMVEYRVEGRVIDQESVTLAPGEETTVEFELDTDELQSGVYVHGIYTEEQGEVGSLLLMDASGDQTVPDSEVTSPDDAFQVSDLSSPDSTQPGDEVTVSATITAGEPDETEETETATQTETATETETETETEAGETETETESVAAQETEANETETAMTETAAAEETETETETSTAGETERVELRINGDVVDTKEVTLEPGESTTVEFTFSAERMDRGVHIVQIDTDSYGDLNTLLITDREQTKTPAQTSTETASGETETEAGETETEAAATETAAE